jgi:hypothetical protein
MSNSVTVMGLLDRLLGRTPPDERPVMPAPMPPRPPREGPADTPYQRALVEFCEHVEEDLDALVSIMVVGESFRQDALELVAGPKDEDGKRMVVGVTLRCEPENTHDPNAVRVEVMGQHVGYVKRGRAKQLHPRIAKCGGATECMGMILGGWLRADGDEGHYGIRVWLRPSERRLLDMK